MNNGVLLPKIEANKVPNAHERYAVVATMGNWDEEAIKGVLPLARDYLGLVASKKRFQETVSRLSSEGASREQLALVTCPAGLDISACNTQFEKDPRQYLAKEVRT
jgi:xanthine dehydrogenase accessory factor